MLVSSSALVRWASLECLGPFWAEMSLPSGVRGPVESLALARLAASWASDRLRGWVREWVRFFLDMMVPFAIRANTSQHRKVGHALLKPRLIAAKMPRNLFAARVTHGEPRASKSGGS